MNTKTLIRKALSLCLIVAVYATYSMVALAGGEKLAGELLVSGKSASVSVNGQEAQSGRTLFSSSTIATPASTSAVVNLGKLGKLELAPNTTASISFTDSGISGNLMSGRITVLGAAESVKITTAENGTVTLGAGESVSAKPKDDDDYYDSNGKCVDADKDGKFECDDNDAFVWWWWVLGFGGAIAAITIAATTDNNRVALGGGTTVTSPNR